MMGTAESNESFFTAYDISSRFHWMRFGSSDCDSAIWLTQIVTCRPSGEIVTDLKPDRRSNVPNNRCSLSDQIRSVSLSWRTASRSARCEWRFPVRRPRGGPPVGGGPGFEDPDDDWD